ncbi:MAG: hypothetical protein PHG61_03620 [Candidatus Marinimicrobia bacterium]|nr:hypothetical protein [Candidatus Neomarinimicrobiota bacterium]
MVSAHAKSAFTVSEMKALLKSKYVGKSKGRNDRIEKNRGGVTYYLFGNAKIPEHRIANLCDKCLKEVRR